MRVSCIQCEHFYECLALGCQRSRAFLCNRWRQINVIFADAEAFQKICQVSMAILQGIEWYFEKPYFTKVIHILDVANVDDFFEILQLPYHLLYRVDANRLNEHQLLNSLETTLCRNWNIKNKIDRFRDLRIRQIAQSTLKGFLENLVEEDCAFRGIEDLKKELKKWIKQDLKKWIKQDLKKWIKQDLKDLALPPECKINQINLNRMQIEIKKKPLFEALAEFSADFVDILCVPSFLQTWKVIDLSFVSNKLGQIKGLRKIGRYSLDEWISIGLCTSFALQLIEACRVLLHKKSTNNEKSMACWDLITACGEVMFNYATLRVAKQPLLLLSLFCAKSLGLLRIIYKPDPLFFEIKPAAH